MINTNSLFRYCFVLALLLMVGSASVSASRLIMPRQQAEHFCQLMLDDGTGASPLYYHARRMMQAEDSLSVEQLFASFILQDDNWQGMRFFPHQEGRGVVWYSAADKLPATINAEHRKYILEVFPRLIAQVEAGDWKTVDAYIEKMVQYQCQFGGSQVKSPVSSAQLTVIAAIFLAILLVSRFLLLPLHPKRRQL
jgi:hypothetical protein